MSVIQILPFFVLHLQPQPGPCAQQFKDCNLLTQKLCTNNFKDRTGKKRKNIYLKV